MKRRLAARLSLAWSVDIGGLEHHLSQFCGSADHPKTADNADPIRSDWDTPRLIIGVGKYMNFMQFTFSTNKTQGYHPSTGLDKWTMVGHGDMEWGPYITIYHQAGDVFGSQNVNKRSSVRPGCTECN